MGLDTDLKKKVVDSWSKISEDERSHFINQISLLLSIYGSDEEGKRLTITIMEKMFSDGAHNLSDFGIYTGEVEEKEVGRADKLKRAALIIDGYRIKNSMSSEPHKDIGI